MRRLILAVVLVAATWAATTYAIGSFAERDYRAGLKTANSNPTLHFSCQSYERSFFDAHALTVIELAPSVTANLDGAAAPRPRIVLEHSIKHGPLAGNTPALATIETRLASLHLDDQLDLTEKAPELRQIPLLTTVTLTGDSHSRLDSPPVHVEEDGLVLDWRGLSLQLDTLGERIISNLVSQGVSFQSADGTFDFKGVEAHVDVTEALPMVMVGSTDVLFSGMTFHLNTPEDGGKAFDLQEIHLVGESAFDGKTISLKQSVSCPGLFTADDSYGPFGLVVEMKNLNGQKLSAFQQEVAEKFSQLAHEDDPEALMLTLLPEYSSLTAELLADSPEFNLKKFYLKTPQGEADAHLALRYNHPGGEVEVDLEKPELLLPNLTAKADLDIDEGLARIFLASSCNDAVKMVEEANGPMSDDEREAFVEQQFQSQLQMGEILGVIIREGEKIISRLSYDQGALEVNGQRVPL